MSNQTLDGRATVAIDLDREEWYQLMIMAHERDITLNQMVEQILRQAIDHYNESQPQSPV